MGSVRWSPRARKDFRDHRYWLRSEAGSRIAEPWIDALSEWVDELRTFPRLGTPRPEFGADVRTRVFRRNITVAYAPDADGVTILRMFGKGRDITAADFRGPE